MTIRGPEALASIEEALRDIRREEDEISKRLARANERITKIRETEAELFRKLARVRLDPNVQRELEGRISAFEAKARKLLDTHARDLAGAEARLGEIDAEIARLTEARAKQMADVETRQDELKTLSARITETVAADPAFARQRAEADELAEIAAQSLRKTEVAEEDREEKGRPYRTDPLFMYLWETGYGTSAYRANNLVRYFDGKVAALTGFSKARPNYAMLNEIPLRLREHAERQLANAAEAAEALERLEIEAIDKAGGKPIREAIEAARREMERLDAAIVAAEDRRDTTAQELAGLAEGSDPAFESALGALAEGLGREDIGTLLAEARRTATGQDDTIVAQIDDARTRVREEEEEVREQNARLRTLGARRRELEDIQWEFKKARFDDPRSSFSEDKLVGDMLNQFLRGGISAALYWDHWRKSQNWNTGGTIGGGFGLPESARKSGAVSWPETSFGGGGNSGASKSKARIPTGFGAPWTGGGGSSPPRGGGSSSGGGFSRPRSGSSGSRKTGGFKTGGGF